MKCSDARRKLSALVDSAGDAALRDAVARHVDGCGACRAELDGHRATDALVGAVVTRLCAAAPPEAYFEDFGARLDARIDARLDEREDEHEAPEAVGEGHETDRMTQPVPQPMPQPVSGLHDLKALAASAIERASSSSDVLARAASTGGVADAVRTASPATLGQVVLPVAGARPGSRRGLVIGMGAGALVVGVLALVLVLGGNRQKGAEVAQAEAPPPAPGTARQEVAKPLPAPPLPTVEPLPVETPTQSGSADTVPAPSTPVVVSPPQEEVKGSARKDTKPEVAVAKPRPPEKAAAAPKSVAPPTPPADAKKQAEPDAKEEAKEAAPPKPAAPDPNLLKEIEEAQEKKKAQEAVTGGAGKPAAVARPPERLSTNDVKSGMDAVAGQVKACGSEHGATGRVKLRVKIAPTGSVAAAEALDSFAGTPVGDCAARAVEKATFPPFEGSPMTVPYSFKLD